MKQDFFKLDILHSWQRIWSKY